MVKGSLAAAFWFLLGSAERGEEQTSIEVDTSIFQKQHDIKSLLFEAELASRGLPKVAVKSAGKAVVGQATKGVKTAGKAAVGQATKVVVDPVKVHVNEKVIKPAKEVAEKNLKEVKETVKEAQEMADPGNAAKVAFKLPPNAPEECKPSLIAFLAPKEDIFGSGISKCDGATGNTQAQPGACQRAQSPQEVVSLVKQHTESTVASMKGDKDISTVVASKREGLLRVAKVAVDNGCAKELCEDICKFKIGSYQPGDAGGQQSHATTNGVWPRLLIACLIFYNCLARH
mmetsp:Transcript_40579/g.71384  ORF Transcript_40579/g.71384 Transcript_40579/m.71384 type:complete len:287 (-) Transcript_40579:27-887(-)